MGEEQFSFLSNRLRELMNSDDKRLEQILRDYYNNRPDDEVFNKDLSDVLYGGDYPVGNYSDYLVSHFANVDEAGDEAYQRNWYDALHDAIAVRAARNTPKPQGATTTTMQYKGEPELREATAVEDVYAKIEARNPGWRRPATKPAVSAVDSTVVKPIVSAVDSAAVKPAVSVIDSTTVTRPVVGDTTTTKTGQPVVTTKQPAAAQKQEAQKSEGPSFSDWMRSQIKAGNYNTIQEWNGKKYHIKYGDEAMHNKAMAKLGDRPNVYGRTAEQYRRIEANEDWK
jgi:hypothetical protein